MNRSFLVATFIGALLCLVPVQSASGQGIHPRVFAPSARPLGQSYSEWTARWWQWFLQHPVANHPGLDAGTFDVTSGQSGNVWFLCAPLDFGPVPTARTRNITVPHDKFLFLGLLNSEISSQEGVVGEQAQRDYVKFITDHVATLECTIDGVAVTNIRDYRFVSPQFEFTAPDPWIFGPMGAGLAGTAVADGYHLFFKPLAYGLHTVHYRGTFEFAAGELGLDPVTFSLDMTYNVNIVH